MFFKKLKLNKALTAVAREVVDENMSPKERNAFVKFSSKKIVKKFGGERKEIMREVNKVIKSFQ